MGSIKKSRTLFFTTSPRSPLKLIPEIKLLIDKFEGQCWEGNKKLQTDYAHALAEASTFNGDTSKKYTDFSARDRITRAPQGLGFVDLAPVIRLTEAGNKFLNSKRPQEIFFRQLIKFQIPSPFLKESEKIKGTFWGHPYLEIIRLINEVVYLTADEFKIFALQLTDYREFERIKNKILLFRVSYATQTLSYNEFVDKVYRQEIMEIYSKEIETGDISTRESNIKDLNKYIKTHMRNLRDYADACFRYLRYTEMFVSDGRSISVSPDKQADVDYVLKTVDRRPAFTKSKKEYKDYLYDASQPKLYSDIRDNLEINLMRHHAQNKRELAKLSTDELKDLKDNLILEKRNRILKEQEEALKSYDLYEEVLETYNDILSNDVYDAPLFLEWNTWRAMTMIDGGTIKGNFKIDDNGKPISTAQGNMPDIECDYNDFALSVEVTLQRGQRQYEMEGEPVTRHYAQLRQKSQKDTYCLFIAPVINKAALAHFFGINQINNISAYGGKPKIIPLELGQFIQMVTNSYNYNGLPKSEHVKSFLDTAIEKVFVSADENEWINNINELASNWVEIV